MIVKFFETRNRKTFIYSLAYVFSVTTGSALGIAAAVYNSREVTDYFQLLLQHQPILATQLIIAFTPLCITHLVAQRNLQWVAHLIVVTKTALFAFSFSAVFVTFPTSGWLVQFLTLAPGMVSICILHRLWMCILVYQHKLCNKEYIYSAFTLLLVLLFDYFFVHPYAASLLIHK